MSEMYYMREELKKKISTSINFQNIYTATSHSEISNKLIHEKNVVEH